MVRTWTEPLGPLRAALRDADLDVRLHVVDIEPALNAALARGGFHAILYGHGTAGITLDVVEALMREHRRTLPVVQITCIDETVEHLRDALAKSRN